LLASSSPRPSFYHKPVTLSQPPPPPLPAPDTAAPASRTLCKQRRLYCNGSVDLRRLDAREAHLFFDSFLFADKLVAPNSQDVVARFGSSSGTYLALSPILRDLWERAKDDSSVQTKFAEWNRLLAKVYGSEIGNDDLFLRHT
jgi:hypothetical protein